MRHLGIADTPFYRLAQHVCDDGWTYLTTPDAPTPAFQTSRGIKQGCPLSPALFSILLSGLLRHLKAHPHPHIPHTATSTFPVFSYTDNIALLGYTPAALSASHAQTETICTHLGLVVSPAWW